MYLPHRACLKSERTSFDECRFYAVFVCFVHNDTQNGAAERVLVLTPCRKRDLVTVSDKLFHHRYAEKPRAAYNKYLHDGSSEELSSGSE